MKVGYLQMIGGVSGDMLLGVLVDVGVNLIQMETELKKLSVEGYRIKADIQKREGVHGTYTQVLVENKEERLGWQDFRSIVGKSGLSVGIKEKSLRVFGNLETAENKVHRASANHRPGELHELGSLDTLIDVVGTVVGLDLLGIERLYASPFPVGGGVIVTMHGALPAAAPATLELIVSANAPVAPPPSDVNGELVTPTGAALVVTLAEFRQPPIQLTKVGYGLGSKHMVGVPNAVSLWVGEEQDDRGEDVVLIETNLDDTNPQIVGFVQERLLNLGALDVWVSPVQMKKNRPGVVLSVLSPSSLEDEVTQLLFRETTTLGVRRRAVQRNRANREIVTVETSLGAAVVKTKILQGQIVAVNPEYESCKKIAISLGLPLKQVLLIVEGEAKDQLLS